MSTRFYRRKNLKEEYSFIYIFTNGAKTEIGYFNNKKSQIRKNDIKIVSQFINSDPLKLVEKVIEQMNATDEYWVVFDKDDFTNVFDRAIQKAKRKGLNVAYSNESFELWFLLHFDFMQSAVGRDVYIKKIEKYYQELTRDKKYEYDKGNIKSLLSLIKGREEFAINNAKKLTMQFDNEISFVKKNPSTTVYLLVERLNALVAQ